MFIICLPLQKLNYFLEVEEVCPKHGDQVVYLIKPIHPRDDIGISDKVARQQP